MIPGKLLIPGFSGGVDGKYQTLAKSADYLRVSTDYGGSWTQKESARDWRDIALSASGQYQAAVVYNGYIYVSGDYGNTWTQRGLQKSYYCIGVSSTGQFMVASDNGNYLYKSDDYGQTWSTLASGKGPLFAMSGQTGQYMIAHGLYSTSIYRSSNYGQSWSTASMPGVYELRGYPSISKDGQHQLVAGLESVYIRPSTVRRSRLWYSSDYGATWSLLNVTAGYQSSSYFAYSDINDAGNQMIFSYDYNNNVRISQDYGVTWTSLPVSERMKMSGSGQHIISGGTTDVNRSEDYGTSWSVAISGLTPVRALGINKST